MDELKSKLDDVLQLRRLLRSRCSSCWSGGVFMYLKHFVSSANRSDSLSVIAFDKLFMKMMKRRGPRILPWGTPDSTDKNQKNKYLKKQIEIYYWGKPETRAIHYLRC